MKPILSAVLTPLVCALILALNPAVQASASTGSPDIQGLWVWRFEWMSTPEAREELLSFCESHGYNLILMQVHLDKKAQPMTFRDPDAMRALVVDAAQRGIKVEALDGAKDMALEENWPTTLAILDTVLAFNATLPDDAKLAGIHYDIEPYILPAWKQGGETRMKIMQDLLAFYTQARTRLDEAGPGMTLSSDIPFWYDNKIDEGDSCVLEFNGQTKNLHQHIQDLCDYVGIMSYRRSATGSNSVTHVVQAELDYAEQIGKFITPALETIELKDVPQITFYGQPAEQFWATHAEVIDTLKDRPGFGGMLTHCYRGMRDLTAAADEQPE